MMNVNKIGSVFYKPVWVLCLLAMSVGAMAQRSGYSGVQNANGMLVFQSEAAFQQVYEDLYGQVNAWDGDASALEKEEEPCEADNPVLDAFEQQFSFTSVRTRFVRLECEQLARGVDPAQIEDHHLVDDVLGTLFNERYQLQIGTDIYYVPEESRGYVIRNADLRALRALEKGGDPFAWENVEILDLRTTCNAGFSVNATSTSTTVGFSFAGSPTTGMTNFFWEFGDGATSTQQNPIHTYAQGGTYTVCLTIETIIDGQECVDRVCREVSVGLENCLAFFIWNETGTPGQLCFNDNSQYLGTPLSWEWNFGDGSPIVTGNNPCHTFPCDKRYNVTLTLQLAGGCTSQVTLPVSVTSYACCARKAKAKGDSYYNGTQNKIVYTQKHLKFPFLYQVVAKMKNFKRLSNGNWKKAKADLKVELLGAVYLKDETGCFCKKPFLLDDVKMAFNKKRISFKKNVGKNFRAKQEAPWSARYSVNGSAVLLKETPVICD